MKIKTDFVTNSSSTSFIIAVNNTNELNKLKRFVKKLNKNPKAANEGVRIYEVLNNRQQLDDYTNGSPYDWASKPRGLQYNYMYEDVYNMCREKIENYTLVCMSVDYNVIDIFYHEINNDSIVWGE